ncbi:cytochrome P450 [Ascobolus immersus RN42]|uniref:Cytochrome P450 n=1 Tax=Ascobolus immersus RN42 TaxID=1160509 RepID=A0A3N4I232_ASCIM|nr:cytochrome P450 [Ascobolus immersus RN42]
MATMKDSFSLLSARVFSQLSRLDLNLDVKSLLLIHLPLLLFTIVAGKIIYLRHFHPLSRFPGPFLGSITNFYQLYIITTGRLEQYEAAWHAKYGPLVRIRPNVLSSSDPRHGPYIYHKNADKTSFQDLPSFGLEESVGSQKSHKVHAYLKKRVAPAFRLEVVKRSENMVDDQILKLLKEWDRRYLKESKDGLLDCAPWTQYLAYDVISEIAFGESKGFLKKGGDVEGLITELLKAIKAGMILSAVADLFLTIYNEPLGIGRWLLKPGVDPKSGLGKIVTFAQNQITTRRNRIAEGKPVRNDVVNHIMSLQNPDGTLVPDSYIRAELTLVTFAGSDTTAANIRHIIISVLSNPSVKAKLIAEIDGNYEAGRLSGMVGTYDDLNANSPYLYAVLKESRRIRAPIPILLPRQVNAPGLHLPVGHGSEQTTVFIPPGVDIGQNSMVTTRDKHYYGPDADEFKPERWLETEVGKAQAEKLERADMTFGAGARVCLGRNIAWMELIKSVSALFRYFDIERVEPPAGGKPYKCENFSLWYEDGIWIRIRRRDVREWNMVDAAVV